MDKKLIMMFVMLAMLIMAAMSSVYLIGFVKGYTSNDTKHQFIIDIGTDIQDMIDAMQNLTMKMTPQNRTCIEGCFYSFDRVKYSENTVAIGDFNPSDQCVMFCKGGDGR